MRLIGRKPNQTKKTKETMRTIEKTLYQFSELSEEAKEKAISYFWDINVSEFFWYEHTEDEIKEQGGELYEFDIGRRSLCKINCNDWEGFAEKILENHGEGCETYETAFEYLRALEVAKKELERLETKLEEHFDDEEQSEFDEIQNSIYDKETEIEEIEGEFSIDIQNDYLKILRDEYDYLTSEKAVVESIEANEWEFDENGEWQI